MMECPSAAFLRLKTVPLAQSKIHSYKFAENVLNSVRLALTLILAHNVFLIIIWPVGNAILSENAHQVINLKINNAYNVLPTVMPVLLLVRVPIVSRIIT